MFTRMYSIGGERMARAIWSPLYSLEEDRSKRYPFPCLRNRTKWSRSISAEEHIFFVFPWKIDGTTWNFPRFRFVFEEFLTQQLTTTDKFSHVRCRFSRDFFLSLSHFSSMDKLVWIVVKWKLFLFEKERYNYSFLLLSFIQHQEQDEQFIHHYQHIYIIHHLL